MRAPLLIVLACLVAPAARASDATGEPTAPELAWHACLREAYARQPGAQSRAASQRGALDACREHEDRTVAEAMAARAGAERPGGARAWAAGVAASLVDPVAAWIGALRR